ncbi:YdcF family protein [Synechococcus sp. MU1651]|uniref:YdcF family protein n=1 Tax=Synechococcus sp. MU1651 TaxID=2508353 RepID=UPI002026C8EE|nr:YdcF family protein [Synechococcus sp. MU1651]
MYLLAKVIPLLILPLCLSLALLFLGLIFRWRALSLAAFLILSFFSLGFVSQSLWRWLEAPYSRHSTSEAPQADAVVVLSVGLHPAPGPNRLSEWLDPDRFLTGLDLYRAGKAPRLLFTGGVSPFSPGQLPEGQHYLQEAASRGVPLAAMSTTLPVINTAEEAAAIRRLLPTSKSRVLLVTSAFHMRRAQKLFEAQGIQVFPFPVDFQARGSWAGPLWSDPTQLMPTAGALANSSRALRELLGRLVYRSW